jgi:hypothetical protein
MKIVRIATIVFGHLLCLFSFSDINVHSQTHPGMHLVLAAKKTTDPRRTVSKSALYTAELSNEGSSTETLEAIQMPGGYAGSGQFFACSLERWSYKQKKWVSLRPAKLSEFGVKPNIRNFQIKPGESMQVCEMMLPSQAGSMGDCVRFRLRMQWATSSSVVLFSRPFLIRESPGIENALCGSTPRR